MTSGRDLFAVAIVGVCAADDRVVLIQRSFNDPHLPGRWSVPGGHVHHGESPEDALRREMLEETGLTVDRAELVGTSIYDEPTYQDRIPVLQLNYLVDGFHGQLHPNTDDVVEARWLSRREIARADWIDRFTKSVLAQSSGPMGG
ncbi:NUDIX hydrolase [Micromonospora sp. NPDC005174]|uniref:NUDIX hydrolase n=1 Tax=Micromonospora sp. NPDC005174 TaxID=3157018 RepID=UPI0033AD69BF